MPALLARPASTTPVFNDDSGRRARILTWLARAACLCFVLVVGAIAFTLLTRVPLPGLGGLLPQEAGPGEPRTAPKHVADQNSDAARASLPSASATTTGTRTAPAQAGAHPRSASAATTTSTVAGPASTAAPAGSSNGQPGSQAGSHAGTPSENANAHATTKTRNPQAAAKKPSPRVVKEPNEHAATGRGLATATDDSAPPPGQSK
jgi:hypothetical protein